MKNLIFKIVQCLVTLWKSKNIFMKKAKTATKKVATDKIESGHKKGGAHKTNPRAKKK